MTGVVLLVSAGDEVLAVRFTSADAARDWEDTHPQIDARGIARPVSAAEALRLS